MSMESLLLGESFSFVFFYLRKARGRELAQLDENRRLVGTLDPVRNKKARPGGEKGCHLSAAMAWPEGRIRLKPKMSVDGLVLTRQGVFGIIILYFVCGVPRRLFVKGQERRQPIP